MPPNRNTLAQRYKIPKFWPSKSHLGSSMTSVLNSPLLKCLETIEVTKLESNPPLNKHPTGL